mmetsp:Transcript_50516/g.120191  ORF Transcript_50516/g.120191 Transcript_50516/m.120191 type:complete len:236 (+) Transcript_50516:322-1029(+)
MLPQKRQGPFSKEILPPFLALLLPPPSRFATVAARPGARASGDRCVWGVVLTTEPLLSPDLPPPRVLRGVIGVIGVAPRDGIIVARGAAIRTALSRSESSSRSRTHSDATSSWRRWAKARVCSRTRLRSMFLCVTRGARWSACTAGRSASFGSRTTDAFAESAESATMHACRASSDPRTTVNTFSVGGEREMASRGMMAFRRWNSAATFSSSTAFRKRTESPSRAERPFDPPGLR